MALTDTWLKANNKKPREKAETVSDRDGLSVRISPKGKITFQLRYRHNNTPKRLDLGTYPNISLKHARNEVLRLKEKLEQGYDPKTVKSLEKVAIIQADTFEELFKAWFVADCDGRVSNAADIMKTFELDVFPAYGNLPARELHTAHWYDLLERVKKRAPSIAERILIYGKQTYRWAVKRRMLDVNPMADISAARDLRIKKGSISKTKGPGKRFLSETEIAWIWDALKGSRMLHRNKLFLRLLLLYGCRGNELREAERSHFDFKHKVWVVPSENHKTGNAQEAAPIYRPIIPIAEEWIRLAMDISNHETHIFEDHRTGEPLDRSHTGQLPYSLMQWLRTNRNVHMDHWSNHDLRRTARTQWSIMKIPTEIAELMLGHSLPSIQDIYDRYEYMDEKRDAYEKWWERLQEIVKD